MIARLSLLLLAALYMESAYPDGIIQEHPTPATTWETYPQIPLQTQKALRAYIFIGGFGDEISGIMYLLAQRLTASISAPAAYYHWHAGTPQNRQQATRNICEDLQAFLKRNPHAQLVLIGHSLGAGTALRVARRMRTEHPQLYLITLDAADRNTRTSRPPSVAWWGNAYVTNSRSGHDFIARLGGRWNNCDQADVNIRFDGSERDERGLHYIHDYADALLLSHPKRQPSLFSLLQQKLTPTPTSELTIKKAPIKPPAASK